MDKTKQCFNRDRPVAIIGAGVMGTKVAWACARKGIPTRLYDSAEGQADRSRGTALTWSQGDEKNLVAQNLEVINDLKIALDGVQLAFENVPENLEIKRSVLSMMGAQLSPDGFIGSNASSITCTPLAAASGCPERFFNMNFTDPRYSRLVEIMTCDATQPETVTFAKSWAITLGMVPLILKKEQLGYSFNRLWRVIKKEVLRQIDEGYCSPADIDRAWMLMFGMDKGPCGIMDEVGLHTVLSVEKIYHTDSGDQRDKPPAVLENLVADNRLGISTGAGFYEYPNPAFELPDFLENHR